MRDKEGNALRNAHVVGFFRRVCKLLFVGVKPVFVFDGGAPALKRETVQRRKRRREGRREDAVRTAGKLLGVQMRRRAELEREEERSRKRRAEEELEEEGIREGEEDKLVYVDELQMTPQERARTRQFKKTDAYHLPALDPDGFHAMGAPNDPRIMSQLELEEYARQFHSGEDVNVYDFSAIDFNGPFFRSLPAGDRYNILNAARLRSRLRMGYSKEQLDGMFPDRMAFSRFQIERVKERNELTQRLMGINGINGEDDGQFGNRVAGEKGKEYVLVKNDGVEGGWALGVVSNKAAGGERNQPIDVDEPGKDFATADMEGMDADAEDEDDGFEDVPIEGLNRLPKRPAAEAFVPDDGFEPEEVIQQRQALYKARQKAVQPITRPSDTAVDNVDDDTDALFVPQAQRTLQTDATWNEETMERLFEDGSQDNSDDNLNRAIALSLQQDEGDTNAPANKVLTDGPTSTYQGPRPDERLEYNQKNAQIGRNVAQLWNARARGMAAPPSRPFLDDSDEEDAQVKPGPADYPADMTVDAPHKETQSKPKSSERFGKSLGERIETTSKEGQNATPIPSLGQNPVSDPAPKFDGPLPFKSLNLGTSKLRKKTNAKVDEADAGGFEKPRAEETRKSPQPVPPWFSEGVKDTTSLQKALEVNYSEDLELNNDAQQGFRARLRRQQTGEVIDLDLPKNNENDIIEVESSSDEQQHDFTQRGGSSTEGEAKIGNMTDQIQGRHSNSEMPPIDHKSDSQPIRSEKESVQDDSDPEVIIEWDESDPEQENNESIAETRTADIPKGHSPSLSPGFESINTTEPTTGLLPSRASASHDFEPARLPNEQSIDDSALDALADDDEDQYSDPEDAELMRQLAIEAEEHARFASTLNSKSQLQNAEDYEQELRQLRNQQKKDRRDADEVSQIMITECQQLLRLFGIPYITAPMEAEAQCAELVSLGLVDGIVTDDSDIFLFGGTRVYKNMFNQAKFVECYLSSDLEKEYSLDRQKLIGVAHLLGSDYTEGIPSVGPVTALEILSEFDNLTAFAEWWSHVQLGQKLSAEDAANPFRRKFKRTASKIFLPNTFPDQRVEQAYLHPEVDRDPSPFAWGVPDLDALRQYLMATIGWTPERTDEVLVPVIKDMNRREDEGTQANITRFFGGAVGTGTKANNTAESGAYAPRRRGLEKSKRMEKALGRLHATATKRSRTIEGDDDDEQAVTIQEEPEDDRATMNGNTATATATAAATTTRRSTAKTGNKANTKAKRKRAAAPKNTSYTNSDSGSGSEAAATAARSTSPPDETPAPAPSTSNKKTRSRKRSKRADGGTSER